MVVLVAVLLIAVVMGFMGYPLLVKEQAPVKKPATKRGKEEKDFQADDVDSALQQLEIDYEAGTIADEEYAELKVAYQRKLAAGRKRSKDKSTQRRPPEELDIERRVMELRRSKQTHCSKCGSPLGEKNKFCPECGAPITPGR